MILEWIGALIVLLVVLPAVVYLLRGVLNAANSIVPSVQQIAAVAHAGSADLDAVAAPADHAGPGNKNDRVGR